jgi:hypothetical protein
MPFHIGFLTRAQMDAAYAASEGFVMTEVQKAVAMLKATSIGATVAADIAAIENKSLSGVEKMATVVSNTVPLIINYLARGGIKAVEVDVLSLAKELSQSVFNDFKSTSAGKIAADILKLFGN